jgi:integrase
MAIRKIKVPKSKKYPKGWAWEVDIRQQGFKRQTRRFASESLAKNVHDAIMGERVRGRYGIASESQVTVDELYKKHFEHLEINRHNFHLSRGKTKTFLERFVNLVGKGRAVTSLKSADLHAYVALRKRAGLAGQSINREMNEIKSMLNSAWKYFPQLESYRAPRIGREPEPTHGRRQTWSEEDLNKILTELFAPRRLHETELNLRQRITVAELFLICQLTGLRIGEARTLHVSQIDFTRQVLIITSFKGKERRERRREVPINNPMALEILGRRAKRNKWIFPNVSDKAPLSTHRKIFVEAADRAEVFYGLKNGGLIANDARRTLLNKLLEEGHDARTLAEIFGHSVETMAKHYRRIKEEQKKAVMGSVVLNVRHSSDARVPNHAGNASGAKHEVPEKSKKKKAFSAKSKG